MGVQHRLIKPNLNDPFLILESETETGRGLFNEETFVFFLVWRCLYPYRVEPGQINFLLIHQFSYFHFVGKENGTGFGFPGNKDSVIPNRAFCC